MLSDDDLTRLRVVAEAAGDEHWTDFHDNTRRDEALVVRGDDDDLAFCPDCGTRAEYDDADARHIAAFDPPTVLALLDLAAERARWEAAIRGLHVRRECNVYDDEECAEGSCEHPPGTCIVLATAVCAHCADQTEPDDGWEHLIREAAYWPCATIRLLSSHDAEVSEVPTGDDRGPATQEVPRPRPIVDPPPPPYQPYA